ncbi:hypothetical protein PGQ11_008000 [Apiospora arundinis]|uniref:Uncharacterized protein n=1 Tax=Apiospora arundinis TaxID=335852 RepID=A0ABR2IXC8_9PEZI
MRVVYILERDDVSGIGVSSYARQISATRKPRIDCVGEVLYANTAPHLASVAYSLLVIPSVPYNPRTTPMPSASLVIADFVVYEYAAHYGDDCALWVA